MVWIIQSSSGRELPSEIRLEDATSLQAELTIWVKDIAAKEIVNLAHAGIRALPLPVRCCGSIIMSETQGAQGEDVEEHVFNRVHLSTAFDLARVSSLQNSTQVHSFADTHGQTLLCVMCLMRVAPNAPGTGKPPIFLSFPFVFRDRSNPLTHWALGNSRDEFHYIVQRNRRLPTEGSSGIQIACDPPAKDQHQSHDNVRLPTGGSTGIQTAAEPFAKDQQLSHNAPNAKVSGVKALSVIQDKWQTMTRQQQLDALIFSDSAIFSRILLDFRILIASEISRTDPRESNSKSLAELLKQFPVLSCLVFDRKMGKAAMMSLQPAFVSHSDAFWSTLQGVAPKLFSGKFRRRRDVSEWPAMLEQPARDFARLQQRIAQLIEQKLWFLADGDVERAPQPRRRRRKVPTTSITQGPSKCITSAPELEVASDVETAANSDSGATESTAGTAITFDEDDEIDTLLRECFIFRDDSLGEEPPPTDELQSRLWSERDETGSPGSYLNSDMKCWVSQPEQQWHYC